MMSTRKIGIAGGAALVIGHCAGMIDLIGLPVWVGALVERYGFEPQKAGALVTLFLVGAVIASVTVSRLFNRLPRKLVTVAGFALAGLAFLVASTQSGFGPLALCHLFAGMTAGAALSLVHGTMGHAANPHRLFAIAGVAIGITGVVFMGAIPQLLNAKGGPAMFVALAAFMGLAMLIALVAFPDTGRADEMDNHSKFAPGVMAVIAGVSLMTFNQAMVFSFVEVIGKARGFAPENVLAVLIVLGLVNVVFPAPLAGLLQNRLAASVVLRVGPAVQALLAMSITMGAGFALWAPSAAFFVAVQIFTHTFAFGLLAKMDRSGRAVAATPAMLMIGSALGPIIGGMLLQNFGIATLGIVAVVVASLSITFFTKGTRA